MNRMQFPERSIPLLKDAAARAPDKEHQERFAFTLFESYLDARDWKNAEAMIDIANRRLTFAERPQWCGRLALIAAQQGAPKDALRIWMRLAEVNPAYTEKLKELAGLGLRPDLIAFYRDMQQKLPGSVIPARALALARRR